MTDASDSRTATEIHSLNGSTPPGAGRPIFRPTTAPKPRPQIRPRNEVTTERRVNHLATSLLTLLRREPILVRKLDMLRLHGLLPEKQVALENVIRRTWRRIDNRTRRLAAMRAPTLRAAALKGDALVETAVVDGRREDVFDALAISLAHDVGHLEVEAACIPPEVRGNFVAYHHAILEAHAAMEAMPPGATDADADPFMERWGDIDRMALADRPRSLSDAIGALAYARREFYQFHIESTEHLGEEPCPGDRLIQHLLDGAAAVLNRVVQTDAADGLARRASEETATISQMADLEFEPWDFEGWTPPTDEGWTGLANPYLITSRIAFKMLKMTKPQLADMIRQVGEEEVKALLGRLQDGAAFYGHYRDMSSAAEVRLMSACSLVAREQGEPEAQLGFDAPPPPVHGPPDRRAVAAYREWLFMEARLLGLEMYPRGGDLSDHLVPANTAASQYHFPLETGVTWRDLPQPTSRAEAMCRVLGIDWTTDSARDEQFMPVVPADATRAA